MALKKNTWEELMERDVHGYTILLDIDGVLMADGEPTIPNHICNHIEILKQKNDIFIVSNDAFKKRCQYASNTLHIPLVESGHLKPSKKILAHVPRDVTKPLLVIGDRVVPDAVFAKRIGGQVVLLTRRTHAKDRRVIKLTYVLDDILYRVLKRLI